MPAPDLCVSRLVTLDEPVLLLGVGLQVVEQRRIVLPLQVHTGHVIVCRQQVALGLPVGLVLAESGVGVGGEWEGQGVGKES